MTTIHNELHARALGVAQRYRGCVAEVIEVLRKLDEHRTYLEYDCTSLYQYAVKHLGFSEDTAVNFITVTRLATKLPRVEAELKAGSITLSKARKIASVVTEKNQEHWLEAAAVLPLKALEREVARVNPKAAVKESATYVTGERIKLELGVSQECLQKLRRAQDLVSSQRQKAVDLEGTLEAVLEFYLDRHDPVKKAERGRSRQLKNCGRTVTRFSQASSASQELNASPKSTVAHPSSTGSAPKTQTSNAPQNVSGRIKPDSTTRERKPLPAHTLHQIHLRDQGQCTHHDSQGARCQNTRWIDIHHLTPVLHGGRDEPENLATLCSAHHQAHHATNKRH